MGLYRWDAGRSVKAPFREDGEVVRARIRKGLMYHDHGERLLRWCPELRKRWLSYRAAKVAARLVILALVVGYLALACVGCRGYRPTAPVDPRSKPPPPASYECRMTRSCAPCDPRRARCL